MKKVIYHSRRKRIPVFGIIFHDDGTEPDVEFYNRRTNTYETMPLSEFQRSLNEYTVDPCSNV